MAVCPIQPGPSGVSPHQTRGASPPPGRPGPGSTATSPPPVGRADGQASPRGSSILNSGHTTSERRCHRPAGDAGRRLGVITSRSWWRLTATALLSLSLLAPLTGSPATAAPQAATGHLTTVTAVRRDLPEPPLADVVRKEPTELTVAAPHPMTGYSRSKSHTRSTSTAPATPARSSSPATAVTSSRTPSSAWSSDPGTAPTTGRSPTSPPPRSTSTTWYP